MNALAAYYVFVVSEDERKIADQRRRQQTPTRPSRSDGDRIRALASSLRLARPTADPAGS